VILRALAKEPSERYHSAEEMDADLERFGRGIGVSAETAEAATTVLSRTSVGDAPTTVRPPSAATTTYTPGRYYEYDETRRRRSIWPWLLALLAIALALIGGFFAYQQLEDQLSASKPVTVPDVDGLKEGPAVRLIESSGLEANVRRAPDSEVPIGFVISQDPEPPVKIEPGNFVTIVVSTGKPKTTVPNVIGRNRDDAIVALKDAKLNPKVFEINSDKQANTVTGQAIKAGKEVIEGTTVRINVSIGPKPIGVPNVVGTAYESAASQLQGIGFGVARSDVEDDAAAGTVVGQDPPAGSQRSKGSTITLQVSKGPKTSTIPDVESQEEGSARSTLEASGFKVRVVEQEIDDQTLDGLVISQDPAGGQEAKPGTTVTIVIGRLPEPPPPTDTGPTDTGPTPP
jgi:eukaryotic-like serine/threonine-protein kinase